MTSLFKLSYDSEHVYRFTGGHFFAKDKKMMDSVVHVRDWAYPFVPRDLMSYSGRPASVNPYFTA